MTKQEAQHILSSTSLKRLPEPDITVRQDIKTYMIGFQANIREMEKLYVIYGLEKHFLYFAWCKFWKKKWFL